MRTTRRSVSLCFLTGALFGQQPDAPQAPTPGIPPSPNHDEDQRLPNGKSQRNAIAKAQHEQAVKDAKHLIEVAEQLRDELEKAGEYVVPMSSVKKTEEIEKLAKRIRSRLED